MRTAWADLDRGRDEQGSGAGAPPPLQQCTASPASLPPRLCASASELTPDGTSHVGAPACLGFPRSLFSQTVKPVGTPFGIRGKKWMAKIKVAKLDGDEMALIMLSKLI
jgi:hypothetical protein